MSRRWRNAGLWLLAVLLVLLLALAWIPSSTGGARMLARLATTLVPPLELEIRDGSLLYGLRIARLRWREPQLAVELEDLRSRWAPQCLLQARWCVHVLRVARISVTTSPLPDAAAETVTPEATGVTLPELSLPLAIELDDAQIGQLLVHSGDTRLTLEDLRARVALGAEGLQLEQLAVRLRQDAQTLDASLRGTVQPHGDYPLALRLAASLRGAEAVGDLDLAADISGSARALQLQATLSGALALELAGKVQPLAPQPAWELEARWPTLAWPPSAPALTSQGGTLRAHGAGGEYSLALDASLSAGPLEQARIGLRAHGDASALELERLGVEHALLRADVDGRLALQPAPAWAGTVRLHHLALTPWLAGAAPLEGRAQLSASAGDNGWQGTIEALELRGEFEGHPLLARARLAADQQGRIQLEQLALSSGDSALRVRGTVQLPPQGDAPSADLRLDWERLAWPPRGAPLVEITAGRAALSGNLERYRGEIETRAAGAQIPPAMLSARLRGGARQVELESLGIDTLGGRVEAGGTLALGETPRFDGRLALAGLDLSRWWPGFTGPLEGSSVVRAEPLAAGGWQLGLENTQLRVAAEGIPLAADMRVSATTEGRIALGALTLASGDSRLRAEGEIDLTDLASDGSGPAAGGTSRLALSWSTLAWPPTGTAIVRARDGSAELSGGLAGYRIALDTRLEAEDLPHATVSLRAAGDTAALRIEQLHLAALDGEVRSEGRIALRGEAAWDATLEFADIDPAGWREALSGRLGGRIRASGGFPADGWSARVTELDIGGELGGKPLRLTGALHGSARGELGVDQLLLVSGENRITVSGGLTSVWSLQGEATLPQPGLLLPGLAGDISARFTVQGDTAAPDIGITLEAQAVRYEALSVAQASLEGNLAALGQASSSLALRVSGVQHEARRLASLTLDASGTRARHQVQIDARGAPVSLTASVSGSVQGADWQGTLAAATVDADAQSWRLGGPLALAWDAQREALQVPAHCWRDGGASLCLREAATLGRSGRLTFALDGFELSRLQVLPERNIALTGTLRAEGAASWRAGATPELDAQARVSKAAMVVEARDDESPLRFEFSTVSVAVQATPDRASARVELDATAAGILHATLDVDMRTGARPLGGRLLLEDFDLAVLAPFFPRLLALEGRVAADGTLSGTLSQPLFDGFVQVSALALTTVDPPLQLKAGQLRADVEGTRARLAGSVRAGGGELRLSGDFSWAPAPWTLELAVEGENIGLSYPPLVKQAALTPKLALRLQHRRVSLTGEVTIPSARITVRELPEGATAVSRDVVVIDAREERGEQDWVVTTRVRVILGDDVRFDGLGLRARLTGNVELSQADPLPVTANGEIRVIEGTYTAYGQDLIITRGRLLFAGSLEHPDINVRAVREVGNVTAGLQLTGPISQPRITLFSEPPQSETNTLAYIVLGRPLESDSSQDNQLVAAAALSLGVRGGRDVAARIAEQVGIQDFEIDAQEDAETGETQLVLRGRLSPNLAVRYGVGVFTPDNTLTLRYDLTRNLYVEAAQGVESALDFFYSFEF